MSDKYDTILKEKKVYEDYTPEHPMFKKFMLIGIFVSFIIIIISYIYYYNTFLNGEAIILNNILKLRDNYSVIFNGYNSYNFDDNYMLDGTVSVNNFNYKYTFIRDGNRIKRSFFNNDRFISYYYVDNGSYVKFSGMDKYISIPFELYDINSYYNDYKDINNNVYSFFSKILLDDNVLNINNRFYTIDNFLDVINNIKSNFTNSINSNRYNKKFYFYNGRPVVKIDLSLNTKDINNILGNGDNNLTVLDDYDVIITVRNDAIMNDIKNVKVIINNKTKDTREVIFYDGVDLMYTDVSGTVYKYNLKIDSKRFNLKIFKDDVLYSALEGEEDSNKYIYSYLYMDKLEKYTLELLNDNNKYNYKFVSNIDNNINNISISGEYYSDGAIDDVVSDSLIYRDVSDNIRNNINGRMRDILK